MMIMAMHDNHSKRGWIFIVFGWLEDHNNSEGWFEEEKKPDLFKNLNDKIFIVLEDKP